VISQSQGTAGGTERAVTYIGGVGDQLTQEDFLVGVERVDDQRHQLCDIGIEGCSAQRSAERQEEAGWVSPSKWDRGRKARDRGIALVPKVSALPSGFAPVVVPAVVDAMCVASLPCQRDGEMRNERIGQLPNVVSRMNVCGGSSKRFRTCFGFERCSGLHEKGWKSRKSGVCSASTVVRNCAFVTARFQGANRCRSCRECRPCELECASTLQRAL
jgi:hypothetical protein